MSTDNDATRRSKRRRSNSFDGANTFDTAEEAPNGELLCPIGEANCCIELGLPHQNCCNGCIQFSDRIASSIDHRDHDAAMTTQLTTRHEKHKHRDKQCLQLWKKDWSQITSYTLRDLHQRQLKFISELRRHRTPVPSRRRVPEEEVEMFDAMAVTPATPSCVLGNDDDQVIELPARAPTKKLRTIHEWHNYSFTCQGHSFNFDLPHSHVTVPKSHLTSLKNDRESLKQLKEGTKMERFTRNASETLKAHVVVALASVPAFALSAASCVIPLIVTAFLQHHCLFDHIGDVSNYAKTFPSESYLRKNVMDQAANNMVWLSQELDEKLVFLACDKGIDHFVKHLAWLDNDGKLQVHLLDLDGSLGTTEDCADAIEKSLKKLNLLRRTIVLQGQSTDGGGGGVLDKLGEELDKRKLIVHDEDYLVGACSIHCLQLQLSNPITDLIGTGGVGNRNAVQLLNVICHLQGYMAWDQVVVMMDYAQEWVDEQPLSSTDYQGDEDNDGDIQFASSFNRVRKFLEFTPTGGVKWKRCSACIATRWQCVGATSKCGFDCYLTLLKFTQMCINRHTSNVKINQAASDLQSLLIDPLCYSDVCLLHCFHDGCFKRHMDWMMQADDLTNKCGFQSHQMATRYFVMERDLTRLKSDVNNCNGFFHHFARSLSLLDDHGAPLHSCESQKNKAQSFVDKSMESLHKHFDRWLTQKLLPASLLADKALAAIVAGVINPTQDPTQWPVASSSLFDPSFDYRSLCHFIDNGPLDGRPLEEKQHDAHHCGLKLHDKLTVHPSQAHKTNIILPEFEQWLRNELSRLGDVAFSEETRVASGLVLDGIDFRDHNAHPLVFKLWCTFSPLASNAQFVERGVKEARIVAATGRKEEQRSACAIIRSFDVLCEDIDRDTPVVKRIEALIVNAEAAVDRDSEMTQKLGEVQHKEAWEEARKHLHADHHRHERVQTQIDSMMVSVEVNHPQNVRQRTEGVTMTLETRGMMAHSNVTAKGGFRDALETELKHREHTEFRCPLDFAEAKKCNEPKLFSVLKDALKSLEIERVKATGGNKEEVKMAEKKGFQKQSAAQFGDNSLKATRMLCNGK